MRFGWLMTGAVMLATAGLVVGQVPVPIPGAGASIGFRNDTKSPVIIQGFTVVGGMIRRGQPVLVAPNRAAGDFNLPTGVRLYSVYDANQPSKMLAKDVPINVPPAGMALFAVRALPNGQVALVPDQPRP